MVGGPSKGPVPEYSMPVAGQWHRAVGAMVVSPALQRGVSCPTRTEPESRRDGAHAPCPSNVLREEGKNTNRERFP